MTDQITGSVGRRKVSRRTLAVGAAWTVPAVAITATAPAFAASGRGPSVNVLGACKQPGNSCNNNVRPYGFVKGYTFLVAFTNNTPQTIYLYSNTAQPAYAPRFQVQSAIPFSYNTARYFTPGLIPPYAGIGAAVGAVITLSPGQTQYVIINAGANDNSQNQSASGWLYLSWGHETTPGTDTDHLYVPIPPTTNPPANWGWIGDQFAFSSMPPCVECIPDDGAAATTSTSPSPSAAAARQADPAGSGAGASAPIPDAPASTSPAPTPTPTATPTPTP